MQISLRKGFEYANIALVCISAVVLIALQLKLYGWIILGLGAISLLFYHKDFAKNILLVYISLAILGITRIDTDISYIHMLEMGMALFLAIAIPYTISRYIYKENTVRFRFHHGRNWYKKEILYVLSAGIISYLLLPFYLKSSGAYLNWTVDPGASNIIRLFIGTNALGIWDELFFVSTVLGIFRKYMTFVFANIAQAILFTSFLYELGFTGWGFLAIFPFAILQGYIFRRTESLLYIITIHLTIDLILFLALIHAHHPTWMPIF